jgi:hypothetical protein
VPSPVDILSKKDALRVCVYLCGLACADTHPQKRACMCIYNMPLKYTQKNTRVFHQPKKNTPRAGAAVVALSLLLCNECVLSIIQ